MDYETDFFTSCSLCDLSTAWISCWFRLWVVQTGKDVKGFKKGDVKYRFVIDINSLNL